MDEKYLALPNYGDIKMTSFIANKTVRILLEHIDFVSDENFHRERHFEFVMHFQIIIIIISSSSSSFLG